MSHANEIQLMQADDILKILWDQRLDDTETLKNCGNKLERRKYDDDVLFATCSLVLLFQTRGLEML